MTTTFCPVYQDKDNKGAFAATWVALHAIADAFPEHPSPEDKMYATRLLDTLSHMLPCDQCNAHLQQELLVFPVRCETGREFSLYVWELHNRVNARLGKPIVSWDQAQQYQKNARQLKWAAIIQSLDFNTSSSINNNNHGARFATVSPQLPLLQQQQHLPEMYSDPDTDSSFTIQPFSKSNNHCWIPLATALVAITAIGVGIWCRRQSQESGKKTDGLETCDGPRDKHSRQSSGRPI